jgi:hypothetical protein
LGGVFCGVFLWAGGVSVWGAALLFLGGGWWGGVGG